MWPWVELECSSRELSGVLVSRQTECRRRSEMKGCHDFVLGGSGSGIFGGCQGGVWCLRG